MRLIPVIVFLGFACFLGHSQKTIGDALDRWNKGSVPYIRIAEVNQHSGAVFLDTRKKEEYNVSHLPEAHWVGHKDFDPVLAAKIVPNKDSPIIVYCSIGVRSEDIGEQLTEMGYSNVLNLYGGIFAWKNENRKIINNRGQSTDSIHAFNKHWGRLLKQGIKIYKTKKNTP